MLLHDLDPATLRWVADEVDKHIADADGVIDKLEAVVVNNDADYPRRMLANWRWLRGMRLNQRRRLRQIATRVERRRP